MTQYRPVKKAVLEGKWNLLTDEEKKVSSFRFVHAQEFDEKLLDIKRKYNKEFADENEKKKSGVCIVA